jgi:ACS family tartrate transporter-like MFS transporter
VVIGLYGTGFWMPQIIRSLDPGFTNFEIGLLMTLPFLAALAGMILWGRHSDRTGERRWHTALPPLLGGIALIGAGLAGSPVLVFLLLIAATAGIFCCFGPFWTLPASVLTGTAAAVGIALVNSIGNLGGFAGPVLMGSVTQITGSMQGGLVAVGICLAAAGVLAAAIRNQDRPGR